ncbi:MAG TPA: AraC family transcriptional regulator [Vicinamibacterales bacterium]|nr:AraC family transcriptional regulator [Vicinamibacterales bacterium]
MGSAERVRWARGSEGIELLEAAFDTFTYDRHTHDTYAIGVTLHGVQRFSCRNATHDSTPGHVMVINPGEAHDGRSGTAGGYMYRMFYVRPDILGAALEDVARRPSDVGARCPVFPDRDLFCQLDLAWRTMATAPASLAADELLHRSLGLLGARVVQPARRASATGDDRVLRCVRDYLQDHVEQDVTLHELSAVAGMSRFQLTRRFQDAYGLPLHAYHLHARLEEGRRRLASGQTIAAVSADLGFVDQSHFHRRFKGSFGMTPGAWRAAHGHRTRRGSSSLSK